MPYQSGQPSLFSIQKRPTHRLCHILAGVGWLYRLTMDQEKTARIMVVGAVLLLSLFTCNETWYGR